MSGPPVPPKRNYKNRIGANSQHHPDLLQQQPGGGNFVGGAGHNVARLLSQHDQHPSHDPRHEKAESSSAHPGQLASSLRRVPSYQKMDDGEEDEQEVLVPEPRQKQGGRVNNGGAVKHRYDRNQPPDEDDYEDNRQNRNNHGGAVRSGYPSTQGSRNQLHDDPTTSSRPLSHQSNQSNNNYRHSNLNPEQQRQFNQERVQQNRQSINQIMNANPYENDDIDEEIYDFPLLNETPDVFIGPEVEIKGDFQYEGLLRLDGKFEGQFVTEQGDLIIGPNAILISDIYPTVRRLWIDGGKVYGQIHVHQLFITGNAVIKGDVTCKYMQIFSGDSSIQGRMFVHNNAPADRTDTAGLFNKEKIIPSMEMTEIVVPPTDVEPPRKGKGKQQGQQQSRPTDTRKDNAPLDPEAALLAAKEAKLAAKQRRKEAKQLLKQELERKAQEQADEIAKREEEEKKKKEEKEEKKKAKLQKAGSTLGKSRSAEKLQEQETVAPVTTGPVAEPKDGPPSSSVVAKQEVEKSENGPPSVPKKNSNMTTPRVIEEKGWKISTSDGDPIEEDDTKLLVATQNNNDKKSSQASPTKKQAEAKDVTTKDPDPDDVGDSLQLGTRDGSFAPPSQSPSKEALKSGAASKTNSPQKSRPSLHDENNTENENYSEEKKQENNPIDETDDGSALELQTKDEHDDAIVPKNSNDPLSAFSQLQQQADNENEEDLGALRDSLEGDIGAGEETSEQ